MILRAKPEGIATGRITQAGQVKDDDPDKKGHLDPPG
jgi:hypothetical protein